MNIFLDFLALVAIVFLGYIYLRRKDSSRSVDSASRDESNKSKPDLSVPEPAISSKSIPRSERWSILDDKNAAVKSEDDKLLWFLLPSEFIVLDIETTGLNPKADEIIEFGAIRATLGLESHPAFQALVKPKKRIPKKITQITGITQKMVDDEGVELSDAFAQLIVFMGDLPVVTYNAEFDMGFIYAAARAHGIYIKNRYACALKSARKAWPDIPSHRLSVMAELGNLNCDNEHRALADCKRALLVFIAATSKINKKVRWSKSKC